jgi:hypothetical protein
LIAWTSTVSLWTARKVSWSASARASLAAWITFWPTMMMGSRTTCRKVWAIHEAELELAMSDQGVLEITDEWITEI